MVVRNGTTKSSEDAQVGHSGSHPLIISENVPSFVDVHAQSTRSHVLHVRISSSDPLESVARRDGSIRVRFCDKDRVRLPFKVQSEIESLPMIIPK